MMVGQHPGLVRTDPEALLRGDHRDPTDQAVRRQGAVAGEHQVVGVAPVLGTDRGSQPGEAAVQPVGEEAVGEEVRRGR